MESKEKAELEFVIRETSLVLPRRTRFFCLFCVCFTPLFLKMRKEARQLDRKTFFMDWRFSCESELAQRRKAGMRSVVARVRLMTFMSEAEARLSRAKPELPKVKRKKIDRLYQMVELASFLVPRRTRMESFEPSYNDLKGDFVKARLRYKSKWARRWLACCFTLHSLLLLGSCFWVLFGEKGRKIVVRLLPEVVKRFWGG